VGRSSIKRTFGGKLDRAFKFFYPDARHPGFQPDVVDFFSTLRTYLDIGAGLVGTGFPDAPDFYRLLRRAIAHLLMDRMRQIDQDRFLEHPFLQEMVRPGHIIVTSNWDRRLRGVDEAGAPRSSERSSRSFGSRSTAT